MPPADFKMRSIPGVEARVDAYMREFYDDMRTDFTGNKNERQKAISHMNRYSRSLLNSHSDDEINRLFDKISRDYFLVHPVYYYTEALHDFCEIEYWEMIYNEDIEDEDIEDEDEGTDYEDEDTDYEDTDDEDTHYKHKVIEEENEEAIELNDDPQYNINDF